MEVEELILRSMLCCRSGRTLYTLLTLLLLVLLLQVFFSSSLSSTQSSLSSILVLPKLSFQHKIDKLSLRETDSQWSSISSIDVDILHEYTRRGHLSDSDSDAYSQAHS